MSNDYFNHTSPVTRATIARASAVNALFTAIGAAFDLLPAKLKLLQGRVTYVVDSGAANAYVVTLDTAPAEYTDGLFIKMKVTNTNTGASTINVNSLGVVDIKRPNGDALEAGDLPAGGVVDLTYNGTNFRMNATISQALATSALIGDGAVTEVKIATGAVTADKIGTGAVTSGKLAADAVATAKIADAAVTQAKIGANAVVTDKINDGAVTADKIGTSAVTTDKLGTGAVTAAKLADEAFTSAYKSKLDGIEASADVNRSLASQAEAEAGTNNTKDMTPLRTAQAIAALADAGVGAGDVGQAELKTTTGEVTTTTEENLTLPGGTYGLYPQIRGDHASSSITAEIGSSAQTVGAYVTHIYLSYSGVSGSGRAQQRYVQASPPYNQGDGDIPLFVYLKVERGSGKIGATYVAPEAPYHYNGPTIIRPDLYVNRTGYRRIKRPVGERLSPSKEAFLERLNAVERGDDYWIEVTHELKNADMNVVPHPFPGIDLNRFTVVQLDPVCKLMERLLTVHETDIEETVTDLIRLGWLTFDNEALPRAVPRGVLCVKPTL